MNVDGLRKDVLVRNRISRNQGIVRRVGRPLKKGRSARVVVRVRMYWWETRRRWRIEERVWSAKNCRVESDEERRQYLEERGPRHQFM